MRHEGLILEETCPISLVDIEDLNDPVVFQNRVYSKAALKNWFLTLHRQGVPLKNLNNARIERQPTPLPTVQNVYLELMLPALFIFVFVMTLNMLSVVIPPFPEVINAKLLATAEADRLAKELGQPARYDISMAMSKDEVAVLHSRSNSFNYQKNTIAPLVLFSVVAYVAAKLWNYRKAETEIDLWLKQNTEHYAPDDVEAAALPAASARQRR